MNNSDTIKNTLTEKFGGDVIKTESAVENRLFVEVKKNALTGVTRELMGQGARYQVSVGYDNSDKDGTMGLIHNFAFDKEGFMVCVNSFTPENDPVFESITPDVPSAGWSEREYMDLLGMKFTNHPKPKRLVLADDWPEGIHPLKKDIPHDLMPPAAEDVAYQMDECPDGCTTIPVGPFHPSLHEPNYWSVYVDGETIKGADYRGFMTHRGIEKLCSTQVSYNEIPFIAERICGICGSVHATAYSQAVEAAAGFTISRRAEFIRVMMLEIERIHSHLLWLGVAGHLIGFDTVFMQSWRVREHIMWLCERITGNRKTYGMIVVGGVRRDFTPEIQEDVLNVVNQVEKELMTIMKSIEGDTAIHQRTKGVGRITRQETLDWSLVGPVARARGVDIDARRDHPYAAYDEVTFDVPVFDSCDVWATVLIRILETFEAIKIIRQCIDRMPAGEIITEMDDIIEPGRHAITSVEAPRGESVHYVITGEENRPDRWRVRAPTYPNLQGVPAMLTGDQFADFPIILGSIDPCFSCTDRVQRVDIYKGSVAVMNRVELEEMSRKARNARTTRKGR